MDFTFSVMSVSITPGWISYTGIPNSAKRTAKTLDIIESPALAMQYAARLVEAKTAETEVMDTMESGISGSAFRISAIQLAKAWLRKKVPFRLMSIRWSKSSSATSNTSALTLGATPALLTRKLSVLNFSFTPLRILSRSAFTAMFPGKYSTRTPFLRS